MRNLAALLLFVFAVVSVDARRTAPASDTSGHSIARLPAAFIENRGQWDTSVEFIAHTRQSVVAFESQAMTVLARTQGAEPVRLTFEGAAAGRQLLGERQRPGIYNFIFGADPEKWTTGVPAFESLLYRDLYDGVHLRARGTATQLEYDLLIAPDADLEQVRVRVDGVAALEIARDGALLMHTAQGTLRQTPPVTWEELPDGGRRPIASRFTKIDNTHYRFEVEGHDRSLPLVIDPGLEWATFLGGSGHETIYDLALARDGSGDVIIAGFTTSVDFPATIGGLGPLGQAPFVARLDATGSVLKYSTLYGGSGVDSALGITVDASSAPVIAGNTSSADFPVTAGAFDTTYNGAYDAYVARLHPATGALAFASYLGGSNDGDGLSTRGYEEAWAVAVEASGAIVVTGNTTSLDFPVTAGAYDTTANRYVDSEFDSLQDMFVARFNASGSALTYSTYLGGQGVDYAEQIAVDSQGFVTIAGRTSPVTRPDVNGNQIPLGTPFPTTAGAFDRTLNGNSDVVVARLHLDGAGAADLKYSTLLGGNDTEHATGLALNPANERQATIAGWTFSGNYPTTAGVLGPTHFAPIDTTMGFVSRFEFPATGGGSLVWSTFYGAPGSQQVDDVTVDAGGAPIVVGASGTLNPPTTERSYDRTPAQSDAFVARINSSATQILYASLLGGSSFEGRARIAYAGGNTVVIGGQTKSTDFPVTAGAQDGTYGADGTPSAFNVYDVFVAAMTLEPAETGDTTVNAPSLISPAAGATFNSPADVSFDWTDVADPSGVEAYHIQVSPNSTFTDTTLAQVQDWYESYPATSQAVADFRARTYFWRVRTLDGAHNFSPFSAVRSFTVGTPPTPTAPTLVSPANGATVDQPVLLDWNDVNAAVSYVIQVDDSNTFSAPRVIEQTVAASQFSASGLVANRRYWWRVRGRNSAGVLGPFSAIRSFTPRAAPATLSLSALSVNPSTVVGGNATTGTATLNGAAPAGGAVVSLVNTTDLSSTAPSVTIPAGATSATFSVSTRAVNGNTATSIEGTYGGVTRSAMLFINTAPPPSSLSTLTVSASGRSGERVTSSPAGINVAVGSTGSASFASGTQMTLSVTNGRDAIWSGACSSGGNKTRTCVFTLNTTASVSANVQ